VTPSRLRLLALLGFALPGCLWAQASSPDASLRAVCEKSRGRIASRANVEEVRHAIVEIQVCPDLAASTLTEAWKSPPGDTVALRLLGEVSGLIGDRRLLASASRVASSSAAVGIRNPRGHDAVVVDDLETCLSHLGFATMLLRRLDRAEATGATASPLTRVLR